MVLTALPCTKDIRTPHLKSSYETRSTTWVWKFVDDITLRFYATDMLFVALTFTIGISFFFRREFTKAEFDVDVVILN